ncbi:MAG: hypothetical protein GF320_21395 [Armatimonadia bacterium]|nr:hypothetical protein [Armatimonadia bacterium]
MASGLAIDVTHSLDGRFRAHVSTPVKDPEGMCQVVGDHEGIQSVEYSSVSGSVLVHHDPSTVRQEEILLRLALFVSIERDLAPVTLTLVSDRSDPGRLAYASGAVLAGALAARWLGVEGRWGRLLEGAAGVGTLAAVAKHTWDDVVEEGDAHPEVLTAGYLLVGLLRGNVLPAAVVTWASSFGRHLAQPHLSVEVQPMRFPAEEDGLPRYEIAVRQDRSSVRPLSVLTALLGYAITGDPEATGNELLHGIRSMSSLHGEVMEGLGGIASATPMSFQSPPPGAQRRRP